MKEKIAGAGKNPGRMSLGIWRDSMLLEMLWQTERRHSLFGRQHPGRSGADWWSARSRSYARRTGGENGKKRQEKLMLMLEKAGYLSKRHEAIDIGCGPGNVALPLARRMKRVIALDPSPDMLAIVKDRAAQEGIKNIETVQLRWEDADLDRLGWRGRFRLAVASMTPGIHDVATLRKMNDASHCGCYFSGFTRRTDSAQEDLWRLFYKQPMPEIPSDIFYVFHLLHCWGYCPSIEMESYSSQRRYSASEAIEELSLLMIPYIEQTLRSRKKMEAHIRSACRDGGYTHERTFVEARMLWTVNTIDGRPYNS